LFHGRQGKTPALSSRLHCLEIGRPRKLQQNDGRFSISGDSSFPYICFMPELYDQIAEATAAVRARWNGRPTVGIILGTGLGALAEDIRDGETIPYQELPHFPHSTVPSHAGELVCGTLAGKSVVAMSGRFHAYEGYSLQRITFPVRVLKSLGC